jgi:hypothetical protein
MRYCYIFVAALDIRDGFFSLESSPFLWAAAAGTALVVAQLFTSSISCDSTLPSPQPTNHLDIDALDWLADYLRPGGRGGRDLTVLLVTHDRHFLERVCNESKRATQSNSI